jgi:hypothetical protein
VFRPVTSPEDLLASDFLSWWRTRSVMTSCQLKHPMLRIRMLDLSPHKLQLGQQPVNETKTGSQRSSMPARSITGRQDCETWRFCPLWYLSDLEPFLAL